MTQKLPVLREWSRAGTDKQPSLNSPIPYESRARENLAPIPARKQSIILGCRAFGASEEGWSLSEDLVTRAVSQLNAHVECRRDKLGGVPVVRGTRFPLAQLFSQLAEEESVVDIAEDFELDQAELSNILHAFAVILNQPINDEGRAIRQE